MSRIDKKEIGPIGESVAARFLESKGFIVIGKNIRFPLGEIDILAQKAGILHFFEVKTSLDISRETHSNPIERISREKLRKMQNAVLLYMKKERIPDISIQLDGISVILNQNKRSASVKVFENLLS